MQPITLDRTSNVIIIEKTPTEGQIITWGPMTRNYDLVPGWVENISDSGVSQGYLSTDGANRTTE